MPHGSFWYHEKVVFLVTYIDSHQKSYRNASNKCLGLLSYFLRKRGGGRLFEGGVYLKNSISPNILFFLAIKISKITKIINN